jgi:lactate dehydrogenase-like 2-hydroxyacid dehydrogenase
VNADAVAEFTFGLILASDPPHPLRLGGDEGRWGCLEFWGLICAENPSIIGLGRIGKP